MSGFIPNADADKINWLSNFASLITADPPRYGMSAAQATFMQSQYDEAEAAYALAVDPPTRTEITIAQKDEEIAGAVSYARQLGALIRPNLGVTDDDKLALGLVVADTDPTPIPPPDSAPLLAPALVGQAGVYLTMVDTNTPNKKAKPFGVLGALLYRASGVEQPLNFDDAEVISILTKSDNVISNAGLTPGTHVSFWAKWFNRKGEIGPLSTQQNSVVV